MRAVRIAAGPGRSATLLVLRADRFAQRLRGLLGREFLLDRVALWISPCCAVHTFGMRRAIDVVFVDGDGRVLRVDSRLEPRRLRCCLGARGVLELAAGGAQRFGLDLPGIRLAGLDR